MLKVSPALSLVLVLGSVAVAQAFSPRLLSFERQLYAAIVLLISAYVCLALVYGRAPLRKCFDLLLWLSFVSLFAIPIATQPISYPHWIAGDCIILITPAFLVFLGEAYPSLYARRNVLIYCGLAALAAIVATGFQDHSRFGRFEPPKVILFGLAWYALLHARKLSARLAAATAVVVLLLLAWHSDVRASVVLWLITGAIVAFTHRSKALAAFVCGGLLIAVINSWLIYGSNVTGALPESRFNRVDYIQGRTLEVLDIADHFIEHGNPATYLLGFGFGATFEADRSTVQTPQGTRHVIHFAPARIMFRYGLLGLAIFIVLGGRICLDVVRLLTRPNVVKRDMEFALFILASFSYFLREFLAPMSNSLDFAYVLAGYIVLRRRVGPALVWSETSRFAETSEAGSSRRLSDSRSYS